MYFPIELWKEIKDFAGIHHLSTDWTFSHVYEGNWVQFYLEWVRPTAEDLDSIKDVQHIKQELLTRAFSLKHWSRVHFLNHAHQQVQEQRAKQSNEPSTSTSECKNAPCKSRTKLRSPKRGKPSKEEGVRAKRKCSV
jgi:hypothetical protein